MADYNSMYQGLYLSPDQQDLLLAALSSNNPQQKQDAATTQPKLESTPRHGASSSFSVSPTMVYDQNHQAAFGYGDDESPYLDFQPDVDFDFKGTDSLIGDLPGSSHLEGSEASSESRDAKRKDMDGTPEENEESGKKRRESDDKTTKKPGRKPLTSEPTSKRKAQNRAAQRAFRERKEKHLKDLETKVEELQKASDSANQENGLLRAQVERLQVELREYRKRLSWVTSGNGFSAMNAIQGPRGMHGLNNSEFLFDFPKFGDLPGGHIFNNAQLAKSNQNKSKDALSTFGRVNEIQVPGVLSRENLHAGANGQAAMKRGSYTSVSTGATPAGIKYAAKVNTAYSKAKSSTSAQDSNSNSPSSSSDSHQSQLLSSSGTSPEPSLNSPSVGKPNESGTHIFGGEICGDPIDGEASFCEKLGMACGNINNPIPAVRQKTPSVSSHTPGQVDHSADQPPAFDFLAQQNGGQFDPVLFGDWREPQDAVLSQDFGTFFNDAFPLPDLGSPSHNFTEVVNQPASKKDLISQIDRKLDDEEEEVVPGEDKAQMLTCTKIWDRLQSMEKFRNGEIDVDHLCSELRTKARCSEGGVVVNQRDVDDIMGRVK